MIYLKGWLSNNFQAIAVKKYLKHKTARLFNRWWIIGALEYLAYKNKLAWNCHKVRLNIKMAGYIREHG